MPKKFAFPSKNEYHRPTDEYVNALPMGSRFGLSEMKDAGVRISPARLQGLTRAKDNPIEKVQSGRKGQRLLYAKVKHPEESDG